MAKRSKRPIIGSVEFVYDGTEKQFNEFLIAVVRDYIAGNDEKSLQEPKNVKDMSEEKTAS